MSNPKTPPTDEELMIAYQQGNSAAFDVLYQRYSARVYAYIKARSFSGSEAGDLFQAVFLKLHQSRRLYRSEHLFAPWLFTICRNAIIDQARRKDPLKENAGEELLAHIAAPAPQPEPAVLGQELASGLAGLSASQRQALEMRYLSESSFEEIAARLNTSQANVRQLVSRALKKLKGAGKKAESV
jgi:RNA polymerase sigma-70 factor (ECF subfamily)